jgi:hypothetical protein
MDMRFHWVKCRVEQGQFIVRWAPGKNNYADFFTKLHPVKASPRSSLKLCTRLSPTGNRNNINININFLNNN